MKLQVRGGSAAGTKIKGSFTLESVDDSQEVGKK